MQRIILLIFLSVSLTLSSQTASEKAMLRKLVQERKDHFEEYTKKADEKNGFFGQSRRDIKNVNETLIEIVKADNRIMHELDRLLSQATYETKQSGTDLAKNEIQRDKFVMALDTLNKQIASLKKEVRSVSWRKRAYKYLDFILIGGIVLYVLYRRRKEKIKSEENFREFLSELFSRTVFYSRKFLAELSSRTRTFVRESLPDLFSRTKAFISSIFK